MRIEGDATKPTYDLINFDDNGVERTDDPDAPGGRMSELTLETIRERALTDVFLMSHGWQGDVPAAQQQYDDWSASMMACTKDREMLRSVRPDFRTFLIGLHWPSRPVGDEELQAAATAPSTMDPALMSFQAGGDDSLARQVELAAAGIADSARAREALTTILARSAAGEDPDTMPAEVEDAYRVLWDEAGLDAEGPAGAPGSDGDSFDPAQLYEQAREESADDASGEVSFGLGAMARKNKLLDLLVSPLRQISFWKMKQRARAFGENGGRKLLRDLRGCVGPDVRIHLMGHSFGCIVMSASVAGQGGDEPLEQPVDSLYLVQGAVSFWSYAAQIPKTDGQAGYFHSIPRDGKVAGPIVTTQSTFDKAVGRLYPFAVRSADTVRRATDHISFAPGEEPELPAYGALGTYGLQGLEVNNQRMLDLDASYGFRPGQIYNLESSHVICEGDGPAGAHSDIAKPEVAHAFWEAVMTGRPA